MKILNWIIKKIPVSENDIPKKWIVATRYKVFGLEFIIWEK